MSWPLPVTPSPAQQADYPTLGFVPCPGDEPTATRVAEVVRETATALDDICDLLSGRTGREQWRGLTAEAFRKVMEDDFRPKAEAARDSFQIAAGALEDWADHMEEAQRDARALEDRAQEAQSALAALPPPVVPPASGFGGGIEEDGEDEEDEDAAAERRELERLRDLNQADLDEARRAAEDLAEAYVEFAEEIADRIGDAISIAPNAPGWLSGIADSIGDMLGDIAGGIGDVLGDIGSWIQDHAASIAAIGDVLAALSMLAGVASLGLAIAASVATATGIGAPVGAALMAGSLAAGTVSAGYAAAALAVHGTARLAGADVSNRTLAQDFFGALPLVGEIRTGGNVARIIGKSVTTQRLSGAAFWDSVWGTAQNPSALDHFMPRDIRQGVEMFVPGGPLLVAFENAWRSGSDES
jgi:hypothetical protein